MKVKILENGTHAKEINRIPKPVAGYYDNRDPYDEVAWEAAKKEWQEAEKALRTFKIALPEYKDGAHEALNNSRLMSEFKRMTIPGSIHDGEIIEGTKIKILNLMKHPESSLQSACVKWFRLQYPKLRNLLFAIPNGGHRNAITAAIMKGEGVLPGVPDLQLAVARNGSHGLFIEMKVGKNTLTQKQREVMADLTLQGYRCYVCRSVEEFIAIVEGYLKF